MSRPTRKCLLHLNCLLAGLLLLVGCTNGGPDVQTQTVAPPTVTSISTSDVSTLSTSTATESSAPSSPVTSESPAASVSAPWPSTFNEAQIDAAKAGLAAVTGLTEVTEQANAAPASKDWTADIAMYAGGAAAMQTLASIQSLVAANVHATAPRTYENLMVLSADDHRVVIEACVDATNLTLVDGSGQSVFTPPANPRVIQTFTLYVPETGGWLVGEMAVSEPERVC